MPADVAIVASATADELRFLSRPHVHVRFHGTGQRESRQTTTRRNVDTPVRPGRTYKRVFAETRISSRMRDLDGN